jgi:hypothetical protein
VKLVAAVVVVVAGIIGVGGLADLTQSRPDAVVDGSSTVVAFDVGTRNYNGSDLDAAQALWATCAPTVSGDKAGPTEIAGGDFEASISPAIGTNGRKRLEGCLADGTLDRVQGHVSSVSSG